MSACVPDEVIEGGGGCMLFNSWLSSLNNSGAAVPPGGWSTSFISEVEAGEESSGGQSMGYSQFASIYWAN